MALGPLNQTTGYTRVLIDLRSQMLELQRQLGTGERSETYGGLGSMRYTSLALSDRTSEVSAYKATIALTSIRLQAADQALGRLAEIANEVKSEAFSSEFQPEGSGQTIEQKAAKLRLDEIVALLNSRADDRYLFGGTELDSAPVETADVILNGDGARAGVIQMIAERKAADLGATELGRLTTTPSAADLTVAEDGSHPFGFKITSIATTITGATVSGPAGAPPSATLTLGANQPLPDDTVQLDLALPDGSKTSVVLTATVGAPGQGEFQIGATVADTITNLNAALQTELQQAANTELEAASAVAASEAFFNGTEAAPPQRVDGPPFDTATALVAGTPANSVIWYQGTTSLGNPRLTAEAQVDDGLKVGYGLEANEDAFRWMIQHVAVFAAETFSVSETYDRERYDALKSRVGVALGYPAGAQSVNHVLAEIGFGLSVLNKADERHDDELAVVEALRTDIRGVDTNQVAAELLTIQTRLEASYEVTAIVSQMRLTNYL